MNLPPRITRSLAAGAVLSAAVLGLGSANGAGAATPPPASALDWLSAELDGTADGVFVYDSGFGDFTDYGLTLDAVLALQLGNAHADVAAASLDAVEDDLSLYVTHPDFGDGNGPGKYAGSIAKVLLTEKVTGRATTIEGFDLEAELRSTLLSTGRRAGRFDGEHGDFSNGVTQALAVLALARTSAGVPASAVDFLLDQQCPGGGFRISYDELKPDFTVDEAASTRGCEDDAEAELDATSFGLEALLSVRTPALAEPIADAIAFLKAPANAPTNANFAGVAGQALRAAGDATAADAAAAVVLGLQLTAGPDNGAIALDADGKAAAPGGTIPADLLPEFWRSTAQGVLAFGLGSYGPVVTIPTSSTTSTTSASTTSTTAGASASSTSTTKASTSTIPKTGSSSARDEAYLGLLLVGLGIAAVGQSRLRTRSSS